LRSSNKSYQEEFKMSEYKTISIFYCGRPREIFVFNMPVDEMKKDKIPETELWKYFCNEVRKELKTRYDMKSRYLVIAPIVGIMSYRDLNKSNRKIIYIEPPAESNFHYSRDANTCIPVVDDE